MCPETIPNKIEHPLHANIFPKSYFWKGSIFQDSNPKEDTKQVSFHVIKQTPRIYQDHVKYSEANLYTFGTYFI